MAIHDKIKYTTTPLPKIMWGVGHKWYTGKIYLETTSHSDNFRESYLLLFKTQQEAQNYISNMNKKYNQNSDGTRSYWYKNRNCFTSRVNTQLKKYKSKYRPLSSLKMSELLGY